MTRWNAWDWAFTLGPFVILTAIAVWTIRRNRTAKGGPL